MSNARISRKHRKAMEREFRPTLDAKDARIAELERQQQNHESTLRRVREDAESAKRECLEFLERANAVKFELLRESPGLSSRTEERWRLMLEIDEFLIRRYFEWGNDARVIDMLGQQLGRKAAQTIADMNYRRTERELVRPLTNAFGRHS